MSLTTVVKNAATTADVYFYNDDGITSFAGVGGASFRILTPNNKLVTQGIGTQDQTNPARWYTTFTIPSAAPITDYGSRYTITWNLSNVKYSKGFTEAFSVNNSLMPSPIDAAITTLAGLPFTASLVLQEPMLQSLNLRIVTYTGVVQPVTITQLVPDIVSGNILPTGQTDLGYVYNVPINPNNSLSANNSGLGSYMAYFNYVDSLGNPQTEIIPVYVASAFAFRLMNDMRRFVDKIRNLSVIPQLRISDVDLMHFALKGVERFNAIPPSNFGIFLNNTQMPENFYFYLNKAACLELVDSLYLAFGMTTFEFGDLSVTLTSDQTQYLQTVAGDLRTDLETAGQAKNNALRSGLGGNTMAMGGVFGPVSNIVYSTVPFSAYGTPFGFPAFPNLPFLT